MNMQTLRCCSDIVIRSTFSNQYYYFTGTSLVFMHMAWKRQISIEKQRNKLARYAVMIIISDGKFMNRKQLATGDEN